MAAPTPVSRLVHSSTLVTAGVYVLIRFGDIFVPLCSYLLIVFSILTIIIAGRRAMRLSDVKKIVALSTLSQVRIIILCIWVGAFEIGFFHLMSHAFFKALIFLCVGRVIFYSGGVQDIRYLGPVWLQMPLVFFLFLVSNFSLIGFPFLSGYYSKDLIIGSCFSGSILSL